MSVVLNKEAIEESAFLYFIFEIVPVVLCSAKWG